MLEILTNPVTVGVIVMLVLCVIKVNVVLALLIAGFVVGIMGHMDLGTIMETVISGLNTNGTNALAYLLLGCFAAALANTGLAAILAHGITSLVHDRKWVLLLLMVLCACISGTIIPIHIAYIPILYPALIPMMNKLKVDRRQAACVTEFGLVAMYITFPIGYGLIFQGIISDNMTANGMPIDVMSVWPGTVPLFIGMLCALALSWWWYRKPREYQDLPINGVDETAEVSLKLTKDHIVSLIAIVGVLFGQLYWDSMPLGALIGLVIMMLGGAIKLRDSNSNLSEGISIMGTVSFIMLIAGGFAAVVQATGAVDELVTNAMAILGGSRAALVFVLIIIGLIITMGIGTSFGTIPIIALLYVPMCQQAGMSVPATVCLIACAAFLGDAGSPASDSTLGPTAGLNCDGQHDHIQDTCIPTFLFFNIPLVIAGFIGCMIL